MSAMPQPLLPEELDRLQGELVGQMEASGCMPLDVAHGFLTATANVADHGQQPVLLDRVLGGLSGDVTLRDLLTRFHAQLLEDLRIDEYSPLILQMPRDDGSMLPLPYGWCQGYVAGVEFLGEDQRDRLIGDQQGGALLTPVLAFLMYEQEQWFDPPDVAAHREAVGELGEAALGLYRWWQQRPGG
ncbi:MAG: YecA family protein [Chromatiaceae bacterium]|jgi:yecA family protein|nr:YecA family protein [Chromatiaceae bacterium]